MHKAKDVARYIINRSIKNNHGRYNTASMQGVLVLSQFAHYQVHKKPLFADPIIYRKLGSRVENISNHFPGIVYEEVDGQYDVEFMDNFFTEDEKGIMDKMIDSFGQNPNYIQVNKIIETYYNDLNGDFGSLKIVR